MYIEIIKSGNYVALIDGIHYGKEGYRIRIPELKVIEDNDLKCSAWILHLMDKTWVTIDTLYRLARVINELHPKNKINWHETFFIVEKSNYLKKLTLDITENEISITEKLIVEIERNQNLSVPKLHEEIDEVVNKKLVKYDILM